MVLVIDVDDYDVFMKYTGGLADYIQKQLNFFIVESIEEAIVKAIVVKAKYKRLDKKDDKYITVSRFDWKNKGKKIKDDPTQKNYCDHYNSSGHVKNKCWILYLELRPKNQRNNQGRNDRKATLTMQQAEDLPEFKQPNTTLALMTSPTDIAYAYNHEQLFHLNIQVKQSVIQAIFDPGSQKNLISEALVKKVGLEIIPYPKPYPLSWIQKDINMQITK